MNDPRSIQRIYNELVAYQKTHPMLQDFTTYSPTKIIDVAIAMQIHNLELLIAEATASLSVLTATGDDLDALIVDRLPNGRLTGAKAVGEISFKRRDPAPYVVTIPIGTRCWRVAPDLIKSYFVTIEEGELLVGQTSVVIGAIAELPGTDSNAPPYSIYHSDPIGGIQYVENQLAFSGGEPPETDDELRSRYIYMAETIGRATPGMIKARLETLEIVYEAMVETVGNGDIIIVVDMMEGTEADKEDYIDEITAEISECIAAGVTSYGVLAAVAKGSESVVELEDCSGGDVYARPKTVIVDPVQINLEGIDTLGNLNYVVIEIPAGAKPYSVWKGDIITDPKLLTNVTGISSPEDIEFDILLGLGTYPYLFNRPELVPVTVTVKLDKTEDAPGDLEETVQGSIEHFLDAFSIGEKIQFSDINRCIYINHEDNEIIDGIDDVTSLIVVVKGTVLTTLGTGSYVEVDADERIEPGVITVEAN